MIPPQIATIIWDWNGTLLNDTYASVTAINTMLERRKLPQLSTEQYREVFTFPVINYYKEIGFTFQEERFEEISVEFHEEYMGALKQCTLHQHSLSILQEIQRRKIDQIVLSAMEKNLLTYTLKEYEILPFFSVHYGLSNKYAVSKEEVGKRAISAHKINPKKAVLIGDTLHDVEVAEALGVHAIIIGNGHQSKHRFKSCNCVVLNSISELPSLFNWR